MTDVTENNDVLNAPSDQPPVVPSNPSEPVAQEASDKIVHAPDVDTKSESTDAAGVRVDPITGISVDQVEAAQGDYVGGPSSDGLRSIPIQAFDSRKLKGDEQVTVRGNTVIVRGEPKARRDGSGDEVQHSKSVQAELKAGREAIERNIQKAE